ncbi:Trihelix transcription factor GTL2 [Heracleum sosnowskyi]|uniref:Trihelix transcription factor GTL2 n=1 Tax=Heracleum sosnowskyi TaxID=360622 RepID=A0AAD8JD86_9APIA|nr:Trihelix transcription factor GTL2 [Heracleum sosnowskyi]
MFGVPQEQFHQLIASSRTLSSLPNNPLPFSTSSPHPFPINFDAYPSSSPPSQSHNHLLHQLHQPPLLLPNKEDDNDAHNKVQETSTIHLQGVEHLMDPWSNDEVLSLLRIRSSMDNWFPDFTWEHVSRNRKMAEFGFKRSAEKCKEKFEAETRDFNRLCFNKPRFDSELEELYHGDKTQKKNEEEDKDEEGELLARNVAINNLPEQRTVEELKKSTASSSSSKQNHEMKKRKREKRFEKFKEFCVEIVNKMMVQQEEMHNKLLEDFLSRDDENIAREEAWKKQEMENFIKEAEIRTREQAIAGDRQATITEIMNKFTSQEAFDKIVVSYEELLKVSNTLSSLTSSYQNIVPQNNSSSTETLSHSNPSNSTSNLPQNLNNYKTPSLSAPSFPLVKPHKPSNERDDIGKRWPKDEVLALINMRCKLYTNNSNNNEEAGAASGGKGSLWERISQGMMELGYKRSAKRCKEKWENINKYFRKTKDVNKKRSVDSRTCPYFQQLSSLYDQGTPVAPDTDGLTSENRSPTSS